MELQNLLKEIMEQKVAASVQINGASPTAGMQAANRRLAKMRLEDLFLQAQKELLKSSVVMVVTGKDAEKVMEVSEKDFDVYAYEYNKLITDFANEIPETSYSMRALGPSTVGLLSALIEAKAIDMGVVEYQPLVWQNSMAGSVNKSKEDFINSVDSLFENTIGYDIPILDIINQTTSKIIQDEFVGNSVPIMILCKDEQKAEKIFNTSKSLTLRSFLIKMVDDDSQKEITSKDIILASSASKKAVKEILINVKQQLKK